MQQIWAKVLAKELEFAGSFSYKTLDVLKNLSADDFKQFELLASLQIDGYLIKGDLIDQRISWTQLLKLQELGLVNLAATQKTFAINENEELIAVDNGNYVIKFHNPSKSEHDVEFQIYMLTSSGIELLKILPQIQREEYIIRAANIIKEKCQNGVTLELHKVNYINGDMVNYSVLDLLE